MLCRGANALHRHRDQHDTHDDRPHTTQQFKPSGNQDLGPRRAHVRPTTNTLTISITHLGLPSRFAILDTPYSQHHAHRPLLTHFRQEIQAHPYVEPQQVQRDTLTSERRLLHSIAIEFHTSRCVSSYVG